MFLTTGIVAALVGLKFAAGFIIGAMTATMMYRRRLTMPRTLRASLAAGVVFVLVSGVAGWALTPRSRMDGGSTLRHGEKTSGLEMQSLRTLFYSALLPALELRSSQMSGQAVRAFEREAPAKRGSR